MHAYTVYIPTSRHSATCFVSADKIFVGPIFDFWTIAGRDVTEAFEPQPITKFQAN